MLGKKINDANINKSQIKIKHNINEFSEYPKYYFPKHKISVIIKRLNWEVTVYFSLFNKI